MATVIGAADLTRAATPQAGALSELQQMQRFAETIGEVIKNVMQIRSQMQPPASAQPQLGMKGSPADVQSNTTTVERIPLKLDRDKLRAFLKDVLSVQAEKLPQELKDAKLGDVLGKNFESFTFLYSGVVRINADMILDKMTDAFLSVVPRMSS